MSSCSREQNEPSKYRHKMAGYIVHAAAERTFDGTPNRNKSQTEAPQGSMHP